MKNVFVLVVAFLIFGTVMTVESQVALAGGGAPFSVLAFPGSSAQSCGTWQASGYGGLSNGKWVAVISLTDATGKLVYIDTLSKIPANGIVSGALSHNPVRNPVRFVAFTLSTTTAKLSIIGDITMDDPCLPPSQSASATTVPTANGTPRPIITLAGKQTPSPHVTPTYGQPVVTITPVGLNAPPLNPTLILTPASSQIAIAALCYGVTVQGSTDKSLIDVELDSMDNGPWVIGFETIDVHNAQFLVTVPFFHPDMNGQPTFPTGTHVMVKLTAHDPSGIPESLGQFPTTVVCNNFVPPAAATPTYVVPAPTVVQQQPTIAFAPTSAVVFGPAPNVYIGCTSAIVSSSNTYSKASYIKVIVSSASNPNVVLDQQVGTLSQGAYNIHLSYPLQAPGTNLVVAIGEWDGDFNRFMDPLLSLAGNCISPTPVYTVPPATPTLVPVPTLVLTAVSPHISLAALCNGVTIQGSSDRPQINIALINMADGSSVGVATSWVDNGRFLITVPFLQPGVGPVLSLPTGTQIMVKLSVLNQDGSSEARGQFETTVTCNNPVPPAVSPTSKHQPLPTTLPATLAPTVVFTPTVPPTAIADNGATDLGTVSIPAGLTQSVNITALKGWDSQDDQSGVEWRWEGAPTGMTITDLSMPAPFEHVFYLTPSATTAIGTYGLTLHAANRTKQWKMQLVMNVIGCRETFQPGTYTLNAAANAASTHFGYGGPDSWRAGLGDQRWFTFCTSPQKRQLTLTMLSATGKTDKLGTGFNFVPDSISFLRYASWPLPPLVTNPLTYLTNDQLTGDLAPENAKVFTWTVRPGAYVIFFMSNQWGNTPDPSATVTYSASLS